VCPGELFSNPFIEDLKKLIRLQKILSSYDDKLESKNEINITQPNNNNTYGHEV